MTQCMQIRVSAKKKRHEKSLTDFDLNVGCLAFLSGARYSLGRERWLFAGEINGSEREMQPSNHLNRESEEMERDCEACI